MRRMCIMKVVKEGEVRKKELLLAARELFISKGYDQTSVNDILNVVGIAKGTFYYYFASKEEVLNGIILDIVELGAQKAEAILSDKSVPVLERIVMAIMAQTPEFEGANTIRDEMHKIENAKLERLYLRRMLVRMTPILTRAVEEAIAEGVCNPEYPEEGVETLLLLGHMMFDCDTFAWEKENYPIKIKAFLSNAEKIMGTEKGAFDYFLRMFAQLEKLS